MKVVKESSACIPGWDRTLLDADHQSMCKFENKTDVNYIRLSGLLARWTEELGRAQEVPEEQNVLANDGPFSVALYKGLLTV